jgi:glycosyltransferase involved in cell wall biosynthesis
MSLGKPCVVTDAGGNKEIIRDHYNGLVTPNNDADMFALSIKELLHDNETLEHYGNNAKNQFIELFSVTSMTEHFQKIYTE